MDTILVPYFSLWCFLESLSNEQFVLKFLSQGLLLGAPNL